ncbi:predicted protein [Plenodomus lingam JN3]|uniref:Predicted protein n=1 Tax=Leptosphaeria maculans (strain JN3 / isolate v23.1.3 / race Av1-4-5-6-7-8) TaxID=985895 RepID=E5A9G2_LEPMJ|nr:predicted protein [Plenodomus lingam JN3]CBY00303.1 predicted protein [Plenodomus lingam JN3]
MTPGDLGPLTEDYGQLYLPSQLPCGVNAVSVLGDSNITSGVTLVHATKSLPMHYGYHQHSTSNTNDVLAPPLMQHDSTPVTQPRLFLPLPPTVVPSSMETRGENTQAAQKRRSRRVSQIPESSPD